MAGGGWYYVPKVWTPTGGWWPKPVYWKRNTAVCFFTIVCISAYTFDVSRKLERRPLPGYTKVPSQYWCTHDTEPRPEPKEGL
eukprot:CAMPEP_0194046914 /NCGR_PEP_ID=MMETSP0009_2-20130614/22949_1 /TAXON_ID=210454 /ORGANISM="Grammatophora oceanica, Strain CCMP 410" /LENGTH=82 /DNA_ID=CAMNT_0038692383 /DNA_START=57 /DNA_END=305 /DNA_ORIENTATION=+